jgi:hypothetical protein
VPPPAAPPVRRGLRTRVRTLDTLLELGLESIAHSFSTIPTRFETLRVTLVASNSITNPDYFGSDFELITN